MTRPKDQKQPKTDKKGFIRGALAGAITGAVDILVTYPTDFIKTRIKDDKINRKYFGAYDCIKKTIKQHGVLGLYRGLSVLLFANIPKMAARFGVYEYFNQRWQNADGKIGISTTFLCGMIAGIVEAVVVITPMEVIKVKVFNDMYKQRPRYRGMFDATRDIIRRSGIRGLFYGLTVTTIKQGTNQAIRFYLMCTQKELYSAYDDDLIIPTPMIGIFGCISGAASVMSNISFDMIRARMEGMSKKYKKAPMTYVSEMVKDVGPQAFFKGTVIRMARVCLDVAITFMIYEKVSGYVTYSFRF